MLYRQITFSWKVFWRRCRDVSSSNLRLKRRHFFLPGEMGDTVFEIDNVPASNEVVRDKSLISEGKAEIIISSSNRVFYNPVQEFNRDLSVAVLRLFFEEYHGKAKKKSRGNPSLQPIEIQAPDAEQPNEDGIAILEALSASGLRSIRYAKEVPGVTTVIANDLSLKAVDSIKANISHNRVEDIVKTSHSDASMLMYSHRRPADKRFDAIDLDPYGCPSVFLDSAVQSIADGGLMLVTATDMAVLAGNAPETCYSKYGAISLHSKACHEMVMSSSWVCHRVRLSMIADVSAGDFPAIFKALDDIGNHGEPNPVGNPRTTHQHHSPGKPKIIHNDALRILLQCIESHANRYGRYIVPLMSVSADFYVRVFVKVFTGQAVCKKTTSKLSMVYQCTGCESMTLQPLGIMRQSQKNTKFSLPTGPPVGETCSHCGHKHHAGGPIWSAPIHDGDFLEQLQERISRDEEDATYGTAVRMRGLVALLREELLDVPLYYTLERLCSIIHSETMRMVTFRSALLNAGYRVSFSHACRTSIKTDAPVAFMWHVMRSWEALHPVKRERISPASPGYGILFNSSLGKQQDAKVKQEFPPVNFDVHPDANPPSRRRGLLRFQENPLPHWGPGTRATVMTDSNRCQQKSQVKQGKRSKAVGNIEDDKDDQDESSPKLLKTE